MKRLLTLILLSFLLTAPGIGYGGIITITDSLKSELVGQQLYALICPKDVTIDQVSQSSDFKPLMQKAPNLGMQKDAVWLKVQVDNKGWREHIFLKINYPILDRVTLYRPADSGFITDNSGEAVPLSKKSLKTPAITFDLRIPSGTQKTYYLKIESSEQIILPIYLTTPEGLLNSISTETFIMGLYMGVILIMVLYNLFLFISVRDKSYFYYVGYILFIGLTQSGIEGYNYLYLWPNSPVFEMNSIQSFSCLGGIFALLFGYQFLRIKEFAPKATKLFVGFGVLFSIALVLPFMGMAQTGFLFMQAVTAASSIFTIIISLYIIRRKKYTPAKFFLTAWGILIISFFIFLSKDFNLLPYNYFTRFSVKIGSVVEIALLSFALAYRINLLKKERLASHLAALRLANENKRILDEQNIRLEQEVKERTQELHNQNNALEQAYHDLTQAQTQLVAAEKMSSLGQLTAGIAHEINNPINFVSANVSPLKRDINQLIEAIDKIETIGLQEKPPAAKKEEINAYKEETEHEYVQQEISHLLNGIQEGADRTAEIVKGLRIFSRLDEDTWKPADINEGLRSTLAISANLLKGIEVVTEFGDLPPVTCYPGKLNQVFLNIITNGIFAIREAHGNNIGGCLTVKTRQEDAFVFVSIKDDGTGMDEETKGKLFDPFFTTKPVGTGTGMGMSIAFSILEQHHATCHVNSEPGQGSEFIIRLYIHPENHTV